LTEGVVITGKDLKVVSCDERASRLSARGAIAPGDSLSSHFPQVQARMPGDGLGGETIIRGVPLEGMTADVHVLPAGSLVVFHFLPHAREGGPMGECSDIEELQGQNRLLMSVIEEAPIGIILLDRAGNILYLNKKQEENSRKQREEILNRHIREVYPKAYRHPEVDRMYESIYSGREQRFSMYVDHYYPQFYRKDMIIKFLGCRLDELDCAVLFIEIEDELYREKRKAEKTGQKLRQSKTFLAQVLDASPNMVISVDKRGRIVSFNRTAELLLGFSPPQVFNTPVERLFPSEELPKIRDALASNAPWFDTIHVYRFDKTTFLTELYAARIKDSETGKNTATLLLMVDIEERERLRKDLIQSKKMSFIGELVSALAHQLNNPLVGVMNLSDVLLHRVDPSDRNYPLLQMIHEAGTACHGIISHLLSFSRKSERQTWVSLDIHEVLKAAIEFVRRHPLFKNVELDLSFQPAPVVRGDPVLLQQAFMNVLFNSAQAVEGRGRISVSCSGVYGMGNQAEVIITDTGQGIPDEDLPRIFEPFFTTKPEDKGTGIGLSLVYWIIQDHKGRIEVESEVGKWTTFRLILPAAMS